MRRVTRRISGFGAAAWAAVAVAAAVAQLAPATPALAQAERQMRERAALQAVRKDIEALQARVARQATQRDEGARALRAAELQIAAAEAKLVDVRAKLEDQQAKERQLRRDTDAAATRLDAERDALARLVRLRYMTGQQEVFKLVLSQESPATLGRMLVYYDYFNAARGARIAAVRGELETLGALRTETEQVAAELRSLEEAQKTEVAALGRARDERRAAVAELEAGIKDGTAEIAKLRAEEKRLADLVVQLGELLAGFPVDSEEPFTRHKGRLAWPVQGRIAGDFGQLRAGGPVKWNGVLLETAAGTPVRAVYRGRVAFADWLPGLGLLAIVDHGEGYMSLYGHNEALLKESGDWVEPGEPIAQVGDTGGQAKPSLYFEIRYKGEPVNPHPWIARRPAR